jgi:gamma-glutamylcysteine synthetase
MVDFTATQAQAKRATTVKILSALPPPTADGVDRMYCQLTEIHTIIAVHLAECACWHQSNPTSCPVRARTGR